MNNLENLFEFRCNYHTHTPRCNHAQGTEKEYIEQALKKGLITLGFSDHSPYPFPNGYNSSFRMKVSDIDNYFSTLLTLKERYAQRIEIKIGFETEYYPKYFRELMSLYDNYPLDYIILGQHITDSELGENTWYMGNAYTEENKLVRYVREVQEAISLGVYTYVAHPDITKFIGEEKIYEKYMTELCMTAKQYHTPLEINMLGIRDKRIYPADRFWKIAGEVGNEVVFGADAHNPLHVKNKFIVKKAVKIVKKYNLNLIEPQLIKPLLRKI